jgi:hypothetical protein
MIRFGNYLVNAKLRAEKKVIRFHLPLPQKKETGRFRPALVDGKNGY